MKNYATSQLVTVERQGDAVILAQASHPGVLTDLSKFDPHNQTENLKRITVSRTYRR